MFDPEDQFHVQALIRAGWTSRRIPAMRPERWSDMVNAIGEDDVVVAAEVPRSDGTKRGRFLISPQGREKLEAWLARTRQAAKPES